MKILSKIKQWWDVGTINPERDEAKMPVLLLWVERAAIIVVAVVSGIAVAAFGYLKAAAYTDIEIIRWLSAGLMFFLATAITDVGVKYFIQKSTYDFFAAFNPATYKESTYNWFQRAMQIVAWACMVAIVGGLFLFDYISVDAVREPVANMVRKEKKLNQDSIRRAVDAQEQVRIGAVVEAIAAIKADISINEQQYKDEKERIVRNLGANVWKDYKAKNEWTIKKFVRPAWKNSSELKEILETRKQLLATKSELEQQRAKDLAYRSNIIAKTDSSTLAENAAIDGRNTSLVSGTSSLFIWMGFWAKCIAGLIRVLLVVMFMGGNVKDYNGDGRIDHTDVNAAAQVGFQTV